MKYSYKKMLGKISNLAFEWAKYSVVFVQIACLLTPNDTFLVIIYIVLLVNT